MGARVKLKWFYLITSENYGTGAVEAGQSTWGATVNIKLIIYNTINIVVPEVKMMRRVFLITLVATVVAALATTSALPIGETEMQANDEMFIGWNGSVTLIDGETCEITPINNPDMNYTINRTSALGTLDAASIVGNFSYTVEETEFGPFIDSIGGVASNDTGQEGWLYKVNNITPEVGADRYQVADGDTVTFWYGTHKTESEESEYVVTINASVMEWQNVTLESGTFSVTAENSREQYDVNRTTALGALDATGVPYTVDDSFYHEYGSLFVDSIDGRQTEGTSGWVYQVNGTVPSVGANVYTVSDWDEVVFYWSESMESALEGSDQIVPIKVSVG